MTITIAQILNAAENATLFNGFRQELMHLQNKMTDTDIAIRARKLARKALRENPKNPVFSFETHKKSLEGKTYEEFLEIMEGDE